MLRTLSLKVLICNLIENLNEACIVNQMRIWHSFYCFHYDFPLFQLSWPFSIVMSCSPSVNHPPFISFPSFMLFFLSHSFHVISVLSMYFSRYHPKAPYADSLRPLLKLPLQFPITNSMIIDLLALIDALQMQVDCKNHESKIQRNETERIDGETQTS